MKLLSFLTLVCLVTTLYGCPKKKTDDDGANVEQSEGSNVSDKTGEGSADEMQEKKGGSDAAAPTGDAAPAAGDADKK
jgi:hypothetical protein